METGQEGAGLRSCSGDILLLECPGVATARYVVVTVEELHTTGDVCDVATAGQELMSCATLVVIVFINYGPAVSASDIYHFTEQFVPQVWWTVCNVCY